MIISFLIIIQQTMDNFNLLYKLNHSKDEKITHLQPVNCKYLRWEQIKKYIIPITVDFTGKTIEEAQIIIHSFIASNCLCRATIDYDQKVYIKQMVEAPIEIYECAVAEWDRISYKMGEKMLERAVYNEILFDCCFLKDGNKLVFFGLFSHLITDGKFDKKMFGQNEFDYYDFISYLDRISGNTLVDFNEYIGQKKNLIDLYLSDEMDYYHFSISDSKMMIKEDYTLEELWTLVIVDFLKRKIPSINKVPINITSGGRRYADKVIDAFGDFHEDYIFVIEQEDKFISDFRYYRETPYLNAKQYNLFIEEHTENNYSQYIEPITISVKWKSEEYSTFQAMRKHLPPHAKNAVVGFNLLIDKNLRKINIDIRASHKIQSFFSEFEVELMESYRSIVL